MVHWGEGEGGGKTALIDQRAVAVGKKLSSIPTCIVGKFIQKMDYNIVSTYTVYRVIVLLLDN